MCMNTSESGYSAIIFLIALLNLKGYRQKNLYIATQGPLKSTVGDFWRMIWEKESKCIVLLTKLIEDDEVHVCF